MARYIDADALIEYIDKNVVCTSRDSEECKQFMIEHLSMEWFAPTADVAPKSEVAREIINDFDEELHKFAERYYEQGKIEYFALCEVIYNLVIAKIKKKYTEETEK